MRAKSRASFLEAFHFGDGFFVIHRDGFAIASDRIYAIPLSEIGSEAFRLASFCSMRLRQEMTGLDRCRQDTEPGASYFRTKICVGKNVGFSIIPALISCFKSVLEGHRIRHYGLFANTGRAANIAQLGDRFRGRWHSSLPLTRHGAMRSWLVRASALLG